MKFLFLILATSLWAQGEQTATDSAEVVNLKSEVLECLRRPSDDFLKAYLPDMSFAYSGRTHSGGVDRNKYVISAFVTAENPVSGCKVEFELFESNLTVGLNNKCGLGENFMYFLLKHDGIYACTPPVAYYRENSINDGYDDLGREINPRKEYMGAFTKKGGCLSQKRPVYFVNYVTEKPTKMRFGLQKLSQCLIEATTSR